MMCNSNLVRVECVNVSQTVTIVPRLEYSSDLLNSIVNILKRKKIELKKLNRNFLELDDDDHTYVKALDFERSIIFRIF